MFQYVLNNYLKKNLNSRVLGFYGKKEMAQHNGLELNKAFKNIKLPKQLIISNFYVLLNKIKNKLSGNNQVLKRDTYDENKIIYDGYWHDLKFFDEETIDLFEFNDDIGSINVEHINKFSKYNSIMLVFMEIFVQRNTMKKQFIILMRSLRIIFLFFSLMI